MSNFYCSDCDFKFRKKDTFNNHNLIHKSRKAF